MLIRAISPVVRGGKAQDRQKGLVGDAHQTLIAVRTNNGYNCELDLRSSPYNCNAALEKSLRYNDMRVL